MWTDVARGSERTRRLKGWLAAALLLAGAGHACALSTDRDQPIAIQADRAEHDDAKRTTIYRGNVVIDQGSLHITGDTVTIRFDARDEPSKIIAVGAPAHFRQLPDGGTDPRKAWAKRMEYFPGQDLIALFGEARYEKDGSRVQADRLVYDSRSARFKALMDAPEVASDEEGQAAGKTPDRVRIRIEPRRKATP